MDALSALQEWLELRAVQGLGSLTLTRLIQQFGSPDTIRRAPISQLTSVAGVSPSLAHMLHEPLPHKITEQIQREIDAMTAGKFSMVTLADPSYPARLRTIPDPPPILSYTGKLLECDEPALAVIGTRKGSHVVRAYTRQLSSDLAALGFTIVSGLARGIDAEAHRGALTSTGKTVAVLGCGIDKTYPAEHRELRQQIERQGAILSEFPMGTAPQSYNFPRRNRVISGLSLGVIVTEATLKSGSLITARLALEQNREVFAVPGLITSPGSQGPHKLIKQGAKLIETPSDIVEEILPMLEPSFRQQLETQQEASQTTLSAVSLKPDEQHMLEKISLEPISLDELIAQGSYSSSEVMSILLSLEVKGLIKQIPGLQYIRVGIR